MLESEDQIEFARESQLRDFIAHNLATLTICSRRLKLYTVGTDGADGTRRIVGVEFPTAVGYIDILTTDEQGDFFLFELKLSRGSDEALGQLQRYMGWVKTELAGAHDVYGIIVAKNVHEKLNYAVRAAPNVFLLEYEIDCRLKPVANGPNSSDSVKEQVKLWLAQKSPEELHAAVEQIRKELQMQEMRRAVEALGRRSSAKFRAPLKGGSEREP